LGAIMKRHYWVYIMSIRSCCLLIIAALVATASSAPQEYLTADGIWARGDTIILFARFNPCGEPYRPIQPLVSRDGGQTWAASGPRLEGSELEYILDTGAELWIGGEQIAEGPSSAPFLLLYRADGAEWPQFVIYDDAAELLGVARETKSGRLLAWVRHIDFQSDNWTGPVYLHQSVDRGPTWSTMQKVRHVPRSAPGLRFFQKLPRQSGRWRISSLGSAVEHQQADGKWHRITRLPLPLQQRCSGPA